MEERSSIEELVSLLKDEQIEIPLRVQIAVALGKMGERKMAGE
jgi:HEAT repeat protein